MECLRGVAWNIAGWEPPWGSGFDDTLAESILNEAVDQGVNFIDTADVYEDRQSEAAVARVVNCPFGAGLCCHQVWTFSDPPYIKEPGY